MIWVLAASHQRYHDWCQDNKINPRGRDSFPIICTDGELQGVRGHRFDPKEDRFVWMDDACMSKTTYIVLVATGVFG